MLMNMKETEAYHYSKNNQGKRTGSTVCIIVRDGHIFVGEAVCSPEDTFSRKVGRELARGRAEARHQRYRNKIEGKTNNE